jgi:hypothetical protein
MDLLFKRYASPFLFMDGMLHTCRFNEFVDEFLQTVNAETEDKTSWEFYLHKVQEGSFKDFKDELETNKQNQNMSKESIEDTIQNSLGILDNFTPSEGGE